MKRVLMVGVVLAAIGVACGGGNSTGNQSAAPKTLRFALIPKALDIPVFDYANKGAQRKAKELGGVEVTYRGPDHSDELKQKEVLESFISQKYDGIAISVLDASFLTSTIDKAMDAGIPVETPALTVTMGCKSRADTACKVRATTSLLDPASTGINTFA